MIMNIGFIGIGAMGLAMAKNLYRKGFGVIVRDIRPEAERHAREIGISVAATPALLAAQSDLIILVVVNAAQIEDVLFGDDGVVQANGGAKTVMLCSTIAPDDTIRFAERLASTGLSIIDAPISGGLARAEAGTISIMLAAHGSLLQRYADVLCALSDKQFHISEKVGDGAKTKLVNNLLAGINLVAGAEAMALGMRIGLDPQTLFNVICASSGTSWIFEDRMARAMLQDFAPRAAAHILTKDVALATSMADAASCDTPMGDAALAIFQQTVVRGWGDLDDASVIKNYLDSSAADKE